MLYRGIREVATRLRVGTVVVHLGRVRFGLTGPLEYTMDADDAVELCRLVDPHTIGPVHDEGWSHFTEGRAAIEAHLTQAPAAIAERVRWAPLGEAVEIIV